MCADTASPRLPMPAGFDMLEFRFRRNSKGLRSKCRLKSNTAASEAMNRAPVRRANSSRSRTQPPRLRCNGPAMACLKSSLTGNLRIRRRRPGNFQPTARLSPASLKGDRLTLIAPAERQGFYLASQFEQLRNCFWMHGFKWMTDGVTLDDAAGFHDGLGCAQAALAVFEIDQWQ